jgi:hypothetical protein
VVPFALTAYRNNADQLRCRAPIQTAALAPLLGLPTGIASLAGHPIRTSRSLLGILLTEGQKVLIAQRNVPPTAG